MVGLDPLGRVGAVRTMGFESVGLQFSSDHEVRVWELQSTICPPIGVLLEYAT